MSQYLPKTLMDTHKLIKHLLHLLYKQQRIKSLLLLKYLYTVHLLLKIFTTIPNNLQYIIQKQILNFMVLHLRPISQILNIVEWRTKGKLPLKLVQAWQWGQLLQMELREVRKKITSALTFPNNLRIHSQ